MTTLTEEVPILRLTDAPDERAQAVIAKGLRDYAQGKVGTRDARPLAVLACDPDTKEVVGGLLGRTSLGLLYIDRFFLPERLRRRGLGRRIIAAAEKEAVGRGCSRAVLFTAHYHAPEFYLRQGYEVLGRLDCEPPGHTRFCMTKKLGAAAPSA
jgi:GNAT superfamily N-acetyltransferase